jgi:hypothetical protein
MALGAAKRRKLPKETYIINNIVFLCYKETRNSKQYITVVAHINQRHFQS